MIYNPLDSFYKSIVGAVPQNKTVKFRVKGNFNSVLFACKKENENLVFHKMERIEDCFETSISFNSGLYFYYFVADDKFITCNSDLEGELSCDNKNKFQLLSKKEIYCHPKWINGGIIYQIFPDRFYSSKTNLDKISKEKFLHNNEDEMPFCKPNKQGVWNNDFFGGDLSGIIQKIPYLKELNVNCVYLNPIFKAFSNHRYDTANYFEIDELLGNENDLIELISALHNNDIKIILDGVFNHVGADSVYFNKYNNYRSLGAYQSKNSPYYSWFNFNKFPNDYDSWWGVKSLPQIKKDSENFFEFIAGDGGVIEKYLKLGVDGFRLDVVDELSNKFIKKIAKKCKQINPNSILIGEVWEDASNKIAYNERKEYFLGEQLDSVMNYPLKNAIINFAKTSESKQLVNVIKSQIDHYPKETINALMNMLSTHDTARILSAISNVDITDLTKEQISKINLNEKEINNLFFKLKVVTLLQFTLAGVPSIYYGDEVGMQGFCDPFNRCYFKWKDEKNDINKWYRFLCEMRKNNNVFADGILEILFFSKNSIVYKRENNVESIIIAVNLGKNDISFSFEGEVFDLISNCNYCNSFTLKENSFSVITAKSNL